VELEVLAEDLQRVAAGAIETNPEPTVDRTVSAEKNSLVFEDFQNRE
jgi:hypothetical protein